MKVILEDSCKHYVISFGGLVGTLKYQLPQEDMALEQPSKTCLKTQFLPGTAAQSYELLLGP